MGWGARTTGPVVDVDGCVGAGCGAGVGANCGWLWVTAATRRLGFERGSGGVGWELADVVLDVAGAVAGCVVVADGSVEGVWVFTAAGSDASVAAATAPAASDSGSGGGMAGVAVCWMVVVPACFITSWSERPDNPVVPGVGNPAAPSICDCVERATVWTLEGVLNDPC
jgi:hypothetical protein